MDVRGIAGERDPTERAPSLGEERSYVLGHETGVAESVREARGLCFAAQVVAVVERDRAARGQRDDRLNVADDRRSRAPDILLGIVSSERCGVGDTGGDIAVEG